MTRDIVRTTSLRLRPEHFGRVHVYRAGARFLGAWRRLEDACNATEYRHLPYKGLETAWRVLSGDFVRMWVNRREPTVLVSRRQLDLDMLQSGLLAWEYAIWPETARGILAEVADDLTCEGVDVWSAVKHRPGACPSADSWVWEAATWEIAHRLAEVPLVLDGPSARLRVDTNAELLTWEDPVTRQGKFGLLQAVHRIKPRLCTVPGLNDPVIHLDSSLTRLADHWANVRTAWIDRGVDRPLLAVEVRARRAGDRWVSFFSDASTEVLRRLDLEHLADPETVNLRDSGMVRAKLSKVPSYFPIGTGPGQMFHEAVALHARRQLPDATAVELVRAKKSLTSPNRDELTADAVEDGIQALRKKRFGILALYAGDDTRKRIVDALAPVLGDDVKRLRDGELHPVGGLEVLFLSPTDAALVLSRNGDAAAIRAWIREVAGPWCKGVPTGAVIETTSVEDRDSKGADPKFEIRDVLARMGVVSQFLSPSSAPPPRRSSQEPATDHAAIRSVWDLLRAAGVFPRQFPTVDGVPSGTLLVGVHIVKRQRPGSAPNRGFVPCVVAVEAGGHEARALTRAGAWRPLGEATAAFHAEDHDLEWDAVLPWVDGGLSRLLASSRKRSMIVFAEASGSRRFWTVLKDTGGDLAPLVLQSGRAALVRVRSEAEEVPRPAGIGPWPAGPGPDKPHTMNALLRLATNEWDGACYYINTPRNMAVQGEHRTQTRFTASIDQPRSLGDNWQALNLTEFVCVDAGPFERDAIYELAALLCREAPTWDGTLDWPSPCHLARAIVEDHPGRYLDDALAIAKRTAVAASVDGANRGSHLVRIGGSAATPR